MPEGQPRLVVIGASAGGVEALLQLAGALPRLFPAPILVVQHVGSQPSVLPELMRARGPNDAMHPEDGDLPRPGTIHVAPPDRHMLLERGRIRITRGPKEHHTRPAIDPLFFSAAVDLGPRVIGVVLTGQMDDGSAGLRAIRECGGTAIVQDPDTAAEPEMPRSALQHAGADHCVALGDLAALLRRLVGQPAAAPAPPPQRVLREAAIHQGERSVDNLDVIGDRSAITCPDCGGALWELKENRPLRFRCHLGHAYSALSLMQAQEAATDEALWGGVRALREREMLLRRFAQLAEGTGDAVQAAAGRARADRLRDEVRQLTRLAEVAGTTRRDQDP